MNFIKRLFVEKHRPKWIGLWALISVGVGVHYGAITMALGTFIIVPMVACMFLLGVACLYLLVFEAPAGLLKMYQQGRMKDFVWHGIAFICVCLWLLTEWKVWDKLEWWLM